MRQEEKAKAYDEAIKVIKDNLDALNEITETGVNIVNIQSIRNCFYKAFPELAESEDERTRKALISFLKSPFVNENITDGKVAPWLAWLEKQGDKDKLIQELGEYKVKYTQEVLSQYLEKQGELSIFNAPSREIILAIWDLGNEWKELTNGCISTEYGTQLDYIQRHWQESEYYLKANQDENKSADKVEPKFKVGDWIINGINTTIMQIIDNKDFYESIGIDGQRRTDKHNYVERNFRLWSINDAKDGDVLVGGDWIGDWIFILKQFNSSGSNNHKCYCHYDLTVDYFKDDTNSYMASGSNDFKPATKEQRDLLFQKMKESEYEWDADAKKLNKVEQKTDSGWSEEDERMLNHIIGYLHSGDDFQTGIDWLKSLEQRIGYKIEVRNIN